MLSIKNYESQNIEYINNAGIILAKTDSILKIYKFIKYKILNIIYINTKAIMYFFKRL